MEVRLTELRYREVINISDGTRLGFVSDAILDLTSGRVLALIVPGPARFFGLFGRERLYSPVGIHCPHRRGHRSHRGRRGDPARPAAPARYLGIKAPENQNIFSKESEKACRVRGHLV